MLKDESAVDPGAALSAEIDAEMLRAAVEALPAEFREVIVLRELEGMSYKEIAAATEVSMGTVMSRLSRARKRLEVALVGTELNHQGTKAPSGTPRGGEGVGEVRDGV